MNVKSTRISARMGIVPTHSVVLCAPAMKASFWMIPRLVASVMKTHISFKKCHTSIYINAVSF